MRGQSKMPFPHSERERDACEDILTNADAALSFTAGMTFDAFVADRRTNYAVVRCLEIISEASRRLSAELRDRHPHVRWRDIADAGNAYRHGYHSVALDRIWETVNVGLPEIIAVCRAELSPPAAS